MSKTLHAARTMFAFAALAMLAQAHVGSPDIYLDSKAGPYQLFITIRTPQVIPGVAELEIRSETPGIRQIRAVPLPMSGPGASFAPVPDQLTASPQDPQLFTGSLWMMAPGSWQVRITAEGAQGTGQIAIPVPSAALTTKKMPFGLGALLSVLGLFLVAGVVAMAGANAREAKLDPGVEPTAPQRRRARVAMAVSFLIVAGILWAGSSWWASEAAAYGHKVYTPMNMQAGLDSSGVLSLNLSDPGWLRPRPGHIALFTRSVDDLIPDHNHLMHLYAIRQPGLDVVYHLHPELVSSGVFRLSLPVMPAGDYKLYADIVHESGFPETLVSTIHIGPLNGRPLGSDDASGSFRPWPECSTTANTFTLPDNYKMVWLRPATLRARQPVLFRFRLETPSGAIPDDMALYLGMPGHAAFLKTDGTVFAHIHPTGSVSMAAFLLAQGQSSDMAGMDMPGMDHHANAVSSEVGFPYGFPTPGRYRLFIQMKHGQTVETGIFDADVR
ncbi:MAG: hypothetical protein JOY54_21130 [Acidobacteriaceae bacterium]|nr:hypothetical protein [Acidobacteriaceae bacterium]